jgi:hypothetical protein
VTPTPTPEPSDSTGASPSASASGHPSYTPTTSPSAGTAGAHGFAGAAHYVQGSGQDLVHVSEQDFATFRDVQVDGVTLTAGQFEARSGSTVVAVKAAYLDTLATGPHTLTIGFTSGPVSDVFTVSGASAGPGGSPTPKPDPSVTYTTSPQPMPNTGAAVGPGAALGLVAVGFGLMLIGAAAVVSRRPVPRRAR